MKELDINLEISYDIDEEDERRYFPNNNININEREDVKTKLLTNVEVIDKCYTSIFYCKGENIFFCRLLKDMFGLKKDDYMLFAFADDKDFYTDEEDYEGCDEFYILYLKNKYQLNDFDTNNNSWKQKIWENPKIHYNIKTINIKIKCKLVLEYEED
jgi:hypothetical protein